MWGWWLVAKLCDDWVGWCVMWLGWLWFGCWCCAVACYVVCCGVVVCDVVSKLILWIAGR